MKMKKITLLFLCFLAIESVSFAQGSYVRFNVGYGMPLGSQVIGYESSSTKYEILYGSYGSGININAAYGMNLSGILGLDFEVGYLIGKEYESTDTFDSEKETISTSVNGFTFAPSLTFTAQEGKILPYARFGPVIGSYKGKYKYSDTDVDFDYSEEEEYTGGISIGLKGSVGAILNPTGKFQFFGELNFVSMSYAPKEGEITKATYNGTDVLSDIYSPEEINFDFVEEFTQSSSDSDRERMKVPMGSLSLQVGVRMNLN